MKDCPPNSNRDLFSLVKLSKRTDRHGNRYRFKARARINGVERWVWDIFLMPLVPRR
jgi:hypothetical protein